MNEPLEGNNALTRWQSLRGALVNRNDCVVTQLADRVSFGLTIYTGFSAPGSGGFAGGGSPTPGGPPVGGLPTCPSLMEVPPALGNADAVRMNYPAMASGSSTPTGEALMQVVDRIVAERNMPQVRRGTHVIGYLS